MIDTPGHVDFSYEVSRALKSMRRRNFSVDATQGVQAQTIANTYMAVEENCKIIPVINKVDLPSADVDGCKSQIDSILGIDASDAIEISAKTGLGVKNVIEAIILQIPPPTGRPEKPLKALVIDSWYDNYKGVVMVIKVVDGCIKEGEEIYLMGSGSKLTAGEIGYSNRKPISTGILTTGMVGYIASGIKELSSIGVGDTLTNCANPAKEKIEGYKQVKPIVFAGIYPEDPDNYDRLKEALEKLKLNDDSINYEPETSNSLGFGFRIGFLGMLHMDISRERIERENSIAVVVTSPTVAYHMFYTNGSDKYAVNPNDFDDRSKIASIKEPIIKITILVPSQFIGNIMKILEERRGTMENLSYITENQAALTYIVPLHEIITDFYDQLKSLSKGMASFDYEAFGEKESDLVKVDILINGSKIDALSFVSIKSKAYIAGRDIIKRLQKLIPRQLF